MTLDVWHQPTCGEPDTVSAWDAAWRQFLHFRGDPLATLAEANAADDTNVVGPAFCAIYRVLGGAPAHDEPLGQEVAWVRDRAGDAPEREQALAGAMELVVGGDFTAAGHHLDEWTASRPDMAGVRIAHDLYLHVGDDEGRLRSSRAAMGRWKPTDPGYGALLGQYSFALEEAGHYAEAEAAGLEALALDPDDLWARHALAHVYEMTDAQHKALALLGDTSDSWAGQELLATHVWWHLGLRLLSAGQVDEVLEIYDSLVPTATTAFRLCDLTSLLWRIELATDRDVGPRWDVLADRWADRNERHTCGFLDLHAALTFSRRPQHPGANQWWQGLEARAARGPGSATSENDRTFAVVVGPLVDAVRAHASGDYEAAVAGFEALGGSTRWVGGSVAQRDIVALTLADARRHLQEET